jgi:hypothetical protein
VGCRRAGDPRGHEGLGVAVEAGFENWAALRASGTNVKRTSAPGEEKSTLLSAVPILFVRDIRKAAAFYADKLAFQIEVLFEEYERRGVEFAQRLVRQAWGGIDFQVRDVDGNVISFVQYRQPESSAE